eukprot:2860-Pyramimonas_sp.AAC.1
MVAAGARRDAATASQEEGVRPVCGCFSPPKGSSLLLGCSRHCRSSISSAGSWSRACATCRGPAWLVAAAEAFLRRPGHGC